MACRCATSIATKSLIPKGMLSAARISYALTFFCCKLRALSVVIFARFAGEKPARQSFLLADLLWNFSGEIGVSIWCGGVISIKAYREMTGLSRQHMAGAAQSCLSRKVSLHKNLRSQRQQTAQDPMSVALQRSHSPLLLVFMVCR